MFGSGGGVKKPADPDNIIQWLTAYDGVTPFVDKKDLVTSPVATDVGCIQFAAVNQFGDCGPAEEDIDVGFYIEATIETTQSSGILVSYGASFLDGKRIQLYVTGGKLAIGFDDNITPINVGSIFTVNDGLPHECRAELRDGDVRFTVDSVGSTASHVMALPYTPNGNLVLGGSMNQGVTGTPTAPFVGKISNVKIGTSAGVEYTYPLEETSGNESFDTVEKGAVGFDHSTETMVVPSPYSGISHEIVHPDIWVFDEPWNGYLRWMVHTPYPDSLSDYENPCIVASNDGINWEAPSGLTNPVIEKPSPVGSFNYDPDIHYDESAGVLRFVWGTFGETSDTARHYFSESSDGVNWTAREEILSVTRSVEGILSPTIIHDGSQWVMWTVDTDIAHTYQNLHKRVKTNWSDPWGSFTVCTMTGMGGAPPDSIWHMKVRLVDGKYRMLFCADTAGGGPLTWAESDDGDTWDMTNKITLSERDTFGSAYYRPTFWPYLTEDGRREYDLLLNSKTSGDWGGRMYRGTLKGQSRTCTFANYIAGQRTTMDSIQSTNLELGFFTGEKNLIQNNGIPTEDTWGLGDGWSISGGNFVVTDTETSDQTVQYIPNIVGGRTYRLEFDAVSSGGGPMYIAGASCFPSTNLGDVDGHVTVDIVADAVQDNKPFIFSTVGWEGTMTNIQLYDTTASTSELIPASQLTPSKAVNGYDITNRGGYVHNGAECSILQTETGKFDAGTANFWNADGAGAHDEKTKAQLDTHFNNTNGSYNLWLKYMGDNTYQSVQYALDKEFTPAEVVKNENYFGGTSGALRDVDGEFILDVDGYVIFTA